MTDSIDYGDTMRKRIVRLPWEIAPLREGERTVLLHLATKGRSSKYQIKKRAKIAYSVVYGALKDLKESPLITIVSIEKSSKNPKIQVEYYDLTEAGLDFVLGFSEIYESNVPPNSRIRMIAKSQRDKCILFKKWQFLDSIGEKQRIIEKMQFYFANYSWSDELNKQYQEHLWDIAHYPPDLQTLIRHRNVLFVLGVLPLTGDKDQKELLSKLKGDSEISKLIDDYLETGVNEARDKLELAEQAIRIWGSIVQGSE